MVDIVAPNGNPFDLFAAWLKEAEGAEPNDPNAMCLASVDKDGYPDVRMVLLKGFDARGFVFFTNHESRKGVQILAHPKAGACFHWKSLRRQVRITGDVVTTSPEESDTYFLSRPKGSRIGAIASHQSRPLDSRQTLIDKVAALEAIYADTDDVPRPKHWAGFRIVPTRIEFWMDGEYRLHDRYEFVRSSPDGGWTSQRLYP